jgi:quercetin dioxygenase-like cupin family protein
MKRMFPNPQRTRFQLSSLCILGMTLAVTLESPTVAFAYRSESVVMTELMSKELADVPGEEMVMLLVDYAPGAVEPIHRHDAYVFVYILQGSVVMQVRGGKETSLAAGQTFYEGPDDVHTMGRNASTTEPAKFIAVMLKKKGAQTVLPTQ